MDTPPLPALAGDHPRHDRGHVAATDQRHDHDSAHEHHHHHRAHEHGHPAVVGPGALSPLWWSARQRLSVAGVLVAGLWLVIGWALS